MALRVKVTWPDVPVADSYKVLRRTGGGSNVLLGTVPAGIFEYEDPTVVLGLTYVYSVVVHNIGGDSAPVEKTVTVILPAPPPVASVSTEVLYP